MSSHSDFVDLLAPTRLHFDRRSVSKVDRMEIDHVDVQAAHALLHLRGVVENRAKQAMEEKRRRLDAAGSADVQRVTADSRRRHVNSPSSDEANIEQDRNKLRNVMNAPSAEPVELSVEYIASCIKKDHDGKPIILGSGSYGVVFLAEDSLLQKKFAVKIIRSTRLDAKAIKKIRQTFQTEMSILKKFRHTNIIALYGYTLNANDSLQCLVYEYAAYGSLADIFASDRKRSRLSAGDRLSIMQELVRAVHFLHTSGCEVEGKNSKVFHRDIKSANICLADDCTPRLIDFGLAESVPNENSNESVALSRAFGPPYGTPAYMCPEYLMRKRKGLPCPYVAAYDVYSIGVVLVEHILGCLNAMPSTRFGTQPLDLFEMYVQEYVQDDRTYQRIVDGWAKLKRDADPIIDWNPDALELVCKAAIQCMAPLPEERLSTKDLLDKISEAINLNANADIQNPAAESAVDSGPRCALCHNYLADIKCSEGHALCRACIVDKRRDDSRCQLNCLIKGCSASQPLRDEDLNGNTNFLG